MNRFFDTRHPFFRPLWRRVALVAATLGWAGFELANGNTIWAAVFGASGAYLFWSFFVLFDPAEYEETDEDP